MCRKTHYYEQEVELQLKQLTELNTLLGHL